MISPGPSGGGPSRGDDRIPVMNSQLAFRVAVVGSLALLVFAVIFLRLWFLQVLTGSSYVAQANTNIVRKVPTAAPRGSILASNNDVLVQSVNKPAILIQPQQLPVALTADPQGLNNQPAKDQAVYTQLAKALGLSTTPSKCTYTITYQDEHGVNHDGVKESPDLAEIPCIIAQHNTEITQGSVTIATNVDVAEQAYISERQREFPGVEVTQIPVSEYPNKGLAAQLLGNIGANNNSATGKALFKNVHLYDSVGQTGLEYSYNKYLQGTDGFQRIEVNAQGEYEGAGKSKVATAGDTLKTSINIGVQKVGQESLQTSLDKVPTSNGGAFVAMDPTNGQIYGLGSLPTFDPNIFQKALTQKQVDQLYGSNSGDPALNRATQSVGPTGSTFKIITATAALESGAWSPNDTYDDTGQFCVSGQCRRNSGGEVGGVLNMETAFEMSDDVFFYNLGDKLNADPSTHPNGGALQEWARKFGIGETPHIDIPYSSSGTVPTPKRTDALITEEEQCDAGTGQFRFVKYVSGRANYSSTPAKGYTKTPKRAEGACGIALLPNAGWTVGDNINMALGQGDVQASPLQLAMAYAAIANGGTLVTPHIGEQVETPTGSVISKIDPAPERKLNINPTYLQTIQTGLRLAASGPTGTSTDVMGSFKLPVSGKTGTAQYIPTSGPNKGQETDYAWYACYVPSSATSKPIVVVVWVEEGGFGDQTAAPVARQILNQWFYGTPGPYVGGSSTSGQGL